MEEQTNLKTIAIKDLWDIFVKRVWLMILAAVIAAGTFFVVNYVTYVPEYSSKATMYILNVDEENNTASGVTTGINLASKLVGDCTHFIKSHTVVDTVINDLKLNMTYEDLVSKISTNNPTDTRFLEVTVRAGSPEEAKAIVDMVCELGSEAINNTIKLDQVNLYEYGIINRTPVNGTGIATYLFIGIIAAVLVYAVFFIMFILDDSVWTDDEIDKYLGLSVLGDIPDANSTQRKGYGYGKYGRYGGKYGRYSAYTAYGVKAEAEKEKGKESSDGSNKGGKK